MNILDIPFVEKIGFEVNDKGQFELSCSHENTNHLQAIHAAAQFALAETASGQILLSSFPELAHKVVPLLRDSQIKFKKPALKTITAIAVIDDEAIEKFYQQFNKRNKASITVAVQVKDVDGTITCTATFNWFVSQLAL